MTDPAEPVTPERGSDRFRVLPQRVSPQDWVVEIPTEPPHPPVIGDPDRDFMLRYCAL
jgi:hypothetical protein